ncbi:MAG: DNA polymerase III subunit epsilon [Bacteroidetes bacterium RIFOXYA12_FULL_35_11]|nr:MAG: DNA polymerase III subunit epsilon [Bacteroidetes bacterium GWF2_35_48]OFY83405.1 MAG: DNA polymerase III subunit epsilon [Bacteroidetes bacterium RIFOXYA12_FULL_35_11]OFY99446.1 MAG: DNA polymerase III subunit epsilon [Bacteroidetes bacterium RIFOXYC12_FULL_35_7]HBX50660.1 DNA polymerase III subunit epsilon [Bacteroidales bacterium]
MTFTAIDFETATGYRNSACAIAIVTVKNHKIIDEYYSLIKPPNNYYWWQNIDVHGITPEDTESAPLFCEIFPELKKRLKKQLLVAHNESFDRSVLVRTMEHYKLNYNELLLPDRWDCTLQIYRSKGFQPASLDACCNKLGIDLEHHHALSDARACAKLYMLK